MFFRPQSVALPFEVKPARDRRAGIPFGAQPRKVTE
jgi:hypothetical protein